MVEMVRKMSKLTRPFQHGGNLTLLLLLAVVFSPGMFLPSLISAEQVTDTPAKVRLQLKWKHQFQFAGYYAAIDKGFFRSEGLDVALVEGKPNLDPVEELLAGRVDFAVDSPAVLIRRQQGQPVVVMAAIFQHSPMVIITRQDSGLTTPQSLKGKRIMLTPKTDLESIAMLVGEGIPLDSMTILPHNWGLDDLIAGRVDGQIVYLTNEPYLLQKAGVTAAIIQPLSYGVDFYGDCIVTTEHEVRAHPEQLEAFRRAVQKGWQYAMNNPEEIAA